MEYVDYKIIFLWGTVIYLGHILVHDESSKILKKITNQTIITKIYSTITRITIMTPL